MPRYLISFDYGTMDVPEGEMPAVAEASHAVIRDAVAAGVLVFAGGVGDPDEMTVVGRDGSTTAGPGAGRTRFIAGMTVIEVPTRAEAQVWAARIAASCRCPQDLREFLPGSVSSTD